MSSAEIAEALLSQLFGKKFSGKQLFGKQMSLDDQHLR
jgi:hypothetical protein